MFELIVDTPELICILAGNHDEALSYDGVRFASSVEPSDFADLLNANLAHEWIERAGKLAVRLFARAPRALFFPDGMLVAHGGFPLVDLHPKLIENAIGTIPHACLISCGPGRTRTRAGRFPTDFPAAASSGMRISRRSVLLQLPWAGR